MAAVDAAGRDSALSPKIRADPKRGWEARRAMDWSMGQRAPHQHDFEGARRRECPLCPDPDGSVPLSRTLRSQVEGIYQLLRRGIVWSRTPQQLRGQRQLPSMPRL